MHLYSVAARYHGVKTLGKFLTPMCLCHQAVQVGTGLMAVMAEKITAGLVEVRAVYWQIYDYACGLLSAWWEEVAAHHQFYNYACCHL